MSNASEWTRPFPFTGETDEKLGPILKFTSLLYFSLIGCSYSHLAPSIRVRAPFIRQSSWEKASVTLCRKYLSAFPYAMETVSGMPRRKSAKSDPTIVGSVGNVGSGFPV